MAAAGTPLLGDGKYGSDRENKKLGEDGQLLCSYRLEFAFRTDAGALNYLNGRSFSVSRVDVYKRQRLRYSQASPTLSLRPEASCSRSKTRMPRCV